jgi:hypothetical protein
MELSLGSISKDEFLRCYPFDVEKDSSHVRKFLQDAYLLKDADEFEYALLLGFSFDFDIESVPILNNLIVEDWHFKHEDIARLLQGFKDSSSIDVLYQTALERYDYLDYDDSYALAVKCIWALGSINTGSSREKLKQLTSSTNQIISDAAEKQLQRSIP